MPANPLSPTLHRPRAVAPARGGARVPGAMPGQPEPAARRALAVLVAAAGGLDPMQPEAAARLRAAAQRVTAQLAADGALPAHLVVRAADPDVVVVRVLAAAGRRLGATPVDRVTSSAPRGAGGTQDGGPGGHRRWSRWRALWRRAGRQGRQIEVRRQSLGEALAVGLGCDALAGRPVAGSYRRVRERPRRDRRA